MSQENVDALRRILAVPPDQAEEFLDLLDEDVVWDPGSRFPGGKAYGRDGVREFFRQWIGAFDDFGYEALEFKDAGDSVFVHMRSRVAAREAASPPTSTSGRSGFSLKAKSSVS
ncbi:MAG: SnoaL-like domain [Thermomicrobiales bacterium]|nr:SnoaL-like domain [Thermomicrobiales bacterium]